MKLSERCKKELSKAVMFSIGERVGYPFLEWSIAGVGVRTRVHLANIIEVRGNVLLSIDTSIYRMREYSIWT
jgi:hypothetical protein